MSENIKQIWENIINNLRTSYTETDIDLWLKSAEPISLDENNFNINVPNKFYQDWINNNSKQQIETILRQTYPNINLNINIDANIRIPEPIDEPKPVINKPNPSNDLVYMDLNTKYTFDSFVVGKSNRFAQAACEAVSKDPGEAYNPLFIYGGVGLGKTHLLHAIGNEVKANKPNAKVLYITADKFMNELIEAIRRDKNIEFRQKYRNVDVLMIDDIQFLAGKESTQEEFFHTFNTLYEAHKQIVISSDSSPKEIPTLEERLRSRFEWGVIADIQPPDLETRIAILRKKSDVEKINVPEDVLLFIASKIKANIRELEGSLIRIAAFALLTKSQITVEAAEDILKDIITRDNSPKKITIERIQNIVAENFNIDPEEINGKRRTDAIAFPRQISMYLARTLTELSTTVIGDQFGGRDHSTVMYACEKIRAKINNDPYFNALINKITQKIRSYDD